MKELIMALVTCSIDPSKSTDFFYGKGSGLVVLFHGLVPPLTFEFKQTDYLKAAWHRQDSHSRKVSFGGLTLTANANLCSVAEYARKPLYRVTCGDIGTKPEEVERHLKMALHLGTIWDCGMFLHTLPAN